MEVRRANPDDAEAIHRLMETAFASFRPLYTPGCFDATVLDPERIRQRMTEGPVWVAQQEGQTVGTIGARDDPRGLYVRGMGVHPDVRRGGIGTALLDAVETHARASAASTMWLSTTLFLSGSIALYQRAGFLDAAGPAHLHGTPLRSFEKRLA